MRIASIGHAVFATTMIALGILGLVKGDFASVWQAVPKGLPGREALAYVCALIELALGAGILWGRSASLAARVLLIYVILWLLLLRVPALFTAPTVVVSWSGCGETAVMVAGAWVLYAWFAGAWDTQHFGFATGERGLRIARAIFGVALIPCGIAHLAYVNETAALVPAWLPAHLFWVYFTGCAYIAAGVAVIFNVAARLAAALAAVQMGAFTLLVWAPMVAASPKDSFQWTAIIISAALAAGAWLVADSYSGVPWLAVGKRYQRSDARKGRMRIANLSQAFFAATLAAIGLLSLVKGGYGPIWDGVPKGFPAREALGYVCALVALASGLGLLWRRTAAPAARLLLAYLLLWMLLVKGRFILLAPTTEVSYENWGETAVLAAAAWVIYAGRAGAWDQARVGFATGAKGLGLARVIYGLALIAFGLSHYAYASDTASLVPAWLPAHPFWVYLTGSAYVAAGVAILFSLYPRFAAALAAVQMAGFTLLVWAPYVATGHPDAGQWSEFVDSWALATAAWVVADSYRGRGWFTVGKR